MTLKALQEITVHDTENKNRKEGKSMQFIIVHTNLKQNAFIVESLNGMIDRCVFDFPALCGMLYLPDSPRDIKLPEMQD